MAEKIHLGDLDTPVGSLYLAMHPRGLCALALGENARQNLLKYLAATYADLPTEQNRHVLSTVSDQLKAYFSGTLKTFDLPLHVRGTDFQKSVWKALLQIPYGTILSYSDLARRLNNPGGMRAVGAANGHNPIPIIIPCHRVVAADGSLGGYTGGLHIKRQLLDLEQRETMPGLFG